MGTASSKESSDRYRLLLVGVTGAGKSATGNSILGKGAFTSRCGMGCVTHKCSLESATRDNIVLEVMDTPGFLDYGRSKEEISMTISRFLAGVSPGPDAVLVVMSAKHRYTEEVDKAYREAKKLLGGNDLVNRIVLVFTGGDILKKEKVDIAQEIQASPQMKKIVQETGERYVVFDNTATGRQQRAQVETLLDLVRKVCVPQITFLSSASQERVNEVIHEEALKISMSEKIPLLTAKSNIRHAMVDATPEDPRLQLAAERVREEIEANALNLKPCTIL